MVDSKPVVVLGSLNMDLVVRTQRAPTGGETLPGQDFNTFPGGKGANQAAAIARMGGNVCMVGRVGDDPFGSQMRASLKANGVNTDSVQLEPNKSSGVALIVVETNGENRIIIVAGANGNVNRQDVDAAAHIVQQARLLVMQFEIDRDTVKYAAELAWRQGVPILLNPAPPYPIQDDLIQKISYLVLNEHEAEIITGLPVTDIHSAETAAWRLANRGARVVILTLGALGAVVTTNEKTFHVPAFPVDAIDTTAAGDAFIGAFVISLEHNNELEKKVRFACAAGALAVTKMGAQNSLPSFNEVKAFASK